MAPLVWGDDQQGKAALQVIGGDIIATKNLIHPNLKLFDISWCMAVHWLRAKGIEVDVKLEALT